MTPAVPLFVPSATSAYLRTNKPIRASVWPSEPLSKARQEQVLKRLREWLRRQASLTSCPSRQEVGPPSATPTLEFPPLIGDPVEVPAIGDALELVLTAVLERKTAASR